MAEPEPTGRIPPGLSWLKDLLPIISNLAIFGGSITFSVIPSITERPPNPRMSAQDVRIYLALAWLFFTLSLGASTIAQAALNFQGTAIHVGFGGRVTGDRNAVVNDRWYKPTYWMFCKSPLSLILQISVLLAFLFLGLVVAAYVDTVGWIAVAFTGIALVFASVVWAVQVVGSSEQVQN